MPTIDPTEGLLQLPAMALRAKQIADRYAEAHAAGDSAASELVSATIAMVLPCLPAITGYREEIKLRGIDVFPGALILDDDGGLWERASDGWRPAGPDAVRPVEVAEFVAALVDLFDRVVRGKSQKNTEEARAMAARLRALAGLLATFPGPGSGKPLLQSPGAADPSCKTLEVITGAEVARRRKVDNSAISKAIARGTLVPDIYVNGAPMFTEETIYQWHPQSRKSADEQ